MRATKAFTLTELLIVIVIIGVLIAILLPSLGAARGAAQSAVDRANLRSLGQGLSLYVADEAAIPRPYTTIAFAGSRGNQFLVRDEGLREHAYTMDPPRIDRENTNATSMPQGEIGDLRPSPADARHGGKANVAWLDGHATCETLESLGYEVLEYAPREGRHGTQIVAVDQGSNAMWNGFGFDRDATGGEP